MTQKFKVGDIVRFGVDIGKWPIYHFSQGQVANFSRYVEASVSFASDEVFRTRQKRQGKSDLEWLWPQEKPVGCEAKYWPHLAAAIDHHEAMHAFLGPLSVDEMKAVTLSAPTIIPLTPAKETHMSKHILALAASRHSAPETTPLSGRLQDALKAAMEKQAQENAEAAAAEILSMIRTLDAVKERERSSIKEARVRIDASVKKMAALDRAMEYAGETENFVPLMQLLGTYIDPNFFVQNPEVARTVPEGWIPAAGPPQTAAKKSKKT